MSFSICFSNCSGDSSLGLFPAPSLTEEQAVLYRSQEKAYDQLRLLIDKGWNVSTLEEKNKVFSSLVLDIETNAIPEHTLLIIQEEIKRTYKEACTAELMCVHFEKKIESELDASILSSIKKRKEELENIRALFKLENWNPPEVNFSILREIFSRLPGPLLDSLHSVRSPSEMPKSKGGFAYCYSLFKIIMEMFLLEEQWPLTGGYSLETVLIKRDYLFELAKKENTFESGEINRLINKTINFAERFLNNASIQKKQFQKSGLVLKLKELIESEVFQENQHQTSFEKIKELLRDLPDECLEKIKKEVRKAFNGEEQALRFLDRNFSSSIEIVQKRKNSLQQILDCLEGNYHEFDPHLFLKLIIPLYISEYSSEKRCFVAEYLRVTDFFNKFISWNLLTHQSGVTLQEFMGIREQILDLDFKNFKDLTVFEFAQSLINRMESKEEARGIEAIQFDQALFLEREKDFSKQDLEDSIGLDLEFF